MIRRHRERASWTEETKRIPEHCPLNRLPVSQGNTAKRWSDRRNLQTGWQSLLESGSMLFENRTHGSGQMGRWGANWAEKTATVPIATTSTYCNWHQKIKAITRKWQPSPSKDLDLVTTIDIKCQVFSRYRWLPALDWTILQAGGSLYWTQMPMPKCFYTYNRKIYYIIKTICYFWTDWGWKILCLIGFCTIAIIYQIRIIECDLFLS